jgi:hypothetical protein
MAEVLHSHSAEVEAWLDCGEHGRIALSRITPKSIVAKTPCDVPPCLADLVVVVDGEVLRRRVSLSGFAGGRRVTLLRATEDVAPF